MQIKEASVGGGEGAMWEIFGNHTISTDHAIGN